MKIFSIILILFILFDTTNVFCQVDSLALQKNYLRMSDSLFEIGQYEKARDYLNASFYTRPKSGETRKSRQEIVEDYNSRKRKLDVLITYELSDSLKYEYRLEKGYHWLLYDYGQATHYFEDAEKYANGRQEAKSEITKIINSLPTDTIELHKYGGKFTLLIKSANNLSPYQYRPFYFFQGYFPTLDTLYLRKDTTLFSGVITQMNAPSAYNSKATCHVWEFESGIEIRMTSHYLCPLDSSVIIERKLNEDDKIILNMANFYCYYCGRIEDSGNKEIWFSIDGDTIQKKETFENGYYSVTYHPNGDTSEFYIHEGKSYTEFNESHSLWNSDGILVSLYKFNQSGEGAWSYSKINQNNDTTGLGNFVNSMAHGVFIDPLDGDNDSICFIKTMWQENKLVDYMSDDIIFFDVSGKIIDEATFLTLIDNDFSVSPQYLIILLNTPLIVEGKIYTFIAYPNKIYRYTNDWDKVWLKINKTIKKVNGKNK